MTTAVEWRNDSEADGIARALPDLKHWVRTHTVTEEMRIRLTSLAQDQKKKENGEFQEKRINKGDFSVIYSHEPKQTCS